MTTTRRLFLAGAALGAATVPAGRAAAQVPAVGLPGAPAPKGRIPPAATPISRLDTPWWRGRHAEALARLRAGPVRLAWYGDSITQDWERTGPPDWFDFAPVWQRYYGDRDAVNLGFKGDSTAHLLWRLRNGQADGISPRAAVVLIGANNLGRVRWGAEPTLDGIGACVAELRRRLPATRILLLSVLPSVRSGWVTDQTAAINAGLSAEYGHGLQDRVTYMDVSQLYLRDGRVDRSQFYDPLLSPPEPVLHPTAQAHARLAAAIEPTLAAMLGDRPKPG